MTSYPEYAVLITMMLFLGAYAQIELLADFIELYNWYFDDLISVIETSAQPLAEIFRTLERAFNLVSEQGYKSGQ